MSSSDRSDPTTERPGKRKSQLKRRETGTSETAYKNCETIDLFIYIIVIFYITIDQVVNYGLTTPLVRHKTFL